MIIRARRGGTWVAGLLVLGAALASAAAEDTSLPRPAPHRALVHAGHRDALRDRLDAMTRALSLDAGQQAEVQRLLERQRTEVTRIWEDAAVPAAYRVYATRLLSEQTADRIRALLTDEQREKFSKPKIERAPPGDALGGRTLDDWIGVATASP